MFLWSNFTIEVLLWSNFMHRPSSSTLLPFEHFPMKPVSNFSYSNWS
uniref:Uncharacterized protein n=1 Tax=Aquilaria malaccensis TaxID=223753 RepID=A0A4Y6GLI0_9ROSI|nr:hypothetical protein [Aquilaria malaccensis]